MQTVRTTITLPADLHEEIRIFAFRNKMSFSDAVLLKMNKQNNTLLDQSDIDKKIEEDFAFFDSIAKMGKKINAVKAVRESRDERARHLLKFLK